MYGCCSRILPVSPGQLCGPKLGAQPPCRYDGNNYQPCRVGLLWIALSNRHEVSRTGGTHNMCSINVDSAGHILQRYSTSDNNLSKVKFRTKTYLYLLSHFQRGWQRYNSGTFSSQKNESRSRRTDSGLWLTQCSAETDPRHKGKPRHWSNPAASLGFLRSGCGCGW